jgi:hypothetical protein
MYHLFQYERDWQCMYNVALRRARETIVVVENQYVLLILSVCVCILAYLSGLKIVCAVFYCHLWSAYLYLIFPHYLINGTIFGNSYRT